MDIIKYMKNNENLKILNKLFNNIIIYNILINQIGLYNTNYIFDSNFKLQKPKLARESSCQSYMQSILNDTSENLNKRWFNERLIRAKKKQKYFDNTYIAHNIYIKYNNGDGFLLYDMIQSPQSRAEILLFRLRNSNKKYSNLLKKCLSSNLSKLPSVCIDYIIEYVIFNLEQIKFNDI